METTNKLKDLGKEITLIKETDNKFLENKKIYLAIPYTGNEQSSFAMANNVAGKLMIDRAIVYSPISHCHEIAKRHKLPTEFDYWQHNDEAFIDWCDAIVVILPIFTDYTIDGSKGVCYELQYAIDNKKEIYYVKESYE